MLRRLTTTLLGLALASSWAQLPTLHIHAYIGHDHPAHRHGPAAHDHGREPFSQPDADGRARLKDCEPGEHVAPVVCVSTSATSPDTGPYETAAPFRTTSDGVRTGRTELTDVRVHGPPARSQSSPRAPPASLSSGS